MQKELTTMRTLRLLIGLTAAAATTAVAQAAPDSLPADFPPTSLAADVARLQGVTIACLGGPSGAWGGEGLTVVSLAAGSPDVLPADLLQYDLVALDWAYFAYTDADRDLLRRFLAAGKGLILSAGVPIYLGNMQSDSLACADFLGAKRYANFGGSITVTGRGYLTQDLDPLLVMRTPGEACGALSEPTTGRVILNHQDLIVALANEYRGGRVFYCSEISRPWEGFAEPHGRLIQRALCWLAKR
jgi:hypothetical protein